MISFYNQDINFKVKNKNRLKQWIKTVVHSKNRRVGDIVFIFCSDDFLLEINQQYLKHNTLTDIITFDYSTENTQQLIRGDIYISIDRIQENAKKFLAASGKADRVVYPDGCAISMQFPLITCSRQIRGIGRYSGEAIVFKAAGVQQR